MYRLNPTSIGTYSSPYPFFGGNDILDCVNDIIPDDDSSYIEWITGKLSFRFDNIPVISEPIDIIRIGIRLNAFGLETDKTSIYKKGIILNGNIYTFKKVILTNGYFDDYYDFFVNPETFNKFVLSDLNDIELYIDVYDYLVNSKFGDAVRNRITQVYIDVITDNSLSAEYKPYATGSSSSIGNVFFYGLPVFPNGNNLLKCNEGSDCYLKLITHESYPVYAKWTEESDNTIPQYPTSGIFHNYFKYIPSIIGIDKIIKIRISATLECSRGGYTAISTIFTPYFKINAIDYPEENILIGSHIVSTNPNLYGAFLFEKNNNDNCTFNISRDFETSPATNSQWSLQEVQGLEFGPALNNTIISGGTAYDWAKINILDLKIIVFYEKEDNDSGAFLLSTLNQ